MRKTTPEGSLPCPAHTSPTNPRKHHWLDVLPHGIWCAIFLVAFPASGAAPNESLTDKTDLHAVAQSGQEIVESESHDTTGFEELTTPVNQALSNGEIRLEAESASIVVRWDAQPGLSHVTARWSFEGTQGILLLSNRANTSVVRYEPDPSIEGYPIIELHLAQDQEASIIGNALAVDAAHAPYDSQPTPGEDRLPPPSSQLDIEASNSNVTLMDIPFLYVAGENNAVFSSGANGSWIFDLQGGSSEVVDHVGAVQFTGQNTETRFSGILGAQTLDIVESKAYVTGARGNIKATTSGGSIEFEDIAGNLMVTGTLTSVAIRRARTSTLALSGDDLYLTMEDGQGKARVSLNGGDFTASKWKTRIDLTARLGTRATVTDLEGDIAIDVADGSSVRITGVSGHVRGKIAGSTIDASQLKSIQLESTNSDITVDSTRNLTTFNLVDSTARLNLYELRGKPQLSLKGSSRADIDLHYPCQVRVEGPGAQNAGRISVDGCDNLRPNQRWAPPRRQRRGEEPIEPIQLTVIMDQRADVSVRGY